jgi:hypothetical protein
MLRRLATAIGALPDVERGERIDDGLENGDAWLPRSKPRKAGEKIADRAVRRKSGIAPCTRGV